MNIRTGVGVIVLLFFVLGTALAKDVYQTPRAFLAETFSGETPKPEMVWLSGALKGAATKIMGHPYAKLRIKYWQLNGRTAWILEEIGKVKPITTGFVIDSDRIERMKVLVFRETRGWEIKYPFFTRQFKGLGLKGDDGLDGNIDGITGATLSVSAVTRLSRLALFLNQHVKEKDQIKTR